MGRALVLNATNEPLSVVSTKRAVVLVLRERASVVEQGEVDWHAELMTITVPSVVRLHRYVRVPFSRRVALNRAGVFARDGSRCQYCHRPAENLDHVIPRSRGGGHTWENVVAACRRCNLRKADRLPDEAGLVLAATPRVPRRDGWVAASTGGIMDSRWRPYLSAV